jgi:cyclin B
MDVDAENADDPQAVVEYVPDIYSRLCREEGMLLPRPDYMETNQPDVNPKMRGILVDWLVEVHMKYKLKTETLFLAVNIIDRFLEKKTITRKRLQLIGVTAMLIAAKFEEIYPPEVRDFVFITDKAYTKEDILSMEVAMLSLLEFNICCPTAAHFLERYQRVNRCNEVHQHLLQYCAELCLPEVSMIRYAPSHLAAAAALLSNKLLKQHPSWSSAMIKHTRQTEKMVKGCAMEMCGLLEAAESSPLQAVRKKFSQPKYHSVAKMTF